MTVPLLRRSPLAALLAFALPLCHVCFAKHYDPSEVLAILDFSGKGVKDHEASLITDRFRSHLVETGKFKVMERGQMRDILAEHGFQQSGACSDASCMIEVGQLLSVRRMVAGTVGKIGGLFTIDVKVIDVSTGEIVLTHSENIKGTIEDVFLTSVPGIAEAFVEKLLDEKPKTGRLTVRSEPPGASVAVDSVDVGTTPLRDYELPVGTHTVGLVLKDYAGQHKTVDIVGGQRAEISFALSRSSDYVKQTSKRRGRVVRVFRIGAGALCGLGLAGAAVFHVDAAKKYDAYGAETADPREAERLWGQVNASTTNRTASLVVAGAGLVGLGVSFAF
jgi:TolB-like protein